MMTNFTKYYERPPPPSPPIVFVDMKKQPKLQFAVCTILGKLDTKQHRFKKVSNINIMYVDAVSFEDAVEIVKNFAQHQFNQGIDYCVPAFNLAQSLPSIMPQKNNDYWTNHYLEIADIADRHNDNVVNED